MTPTPSQYPEDVRSAAEAASAAWISPTRVGEQSLADMVADAIMADREARAPVPAGPIAGVRLPPAERKLLALFVGKPLVTRKDVVKATSRSPFVVDKVADVHIARLRRRFGAEIEILNIRGEGYSLTDRDKWGHALRAAAASDAARSIQIAGRA